MGDDQLQRWAQEWPIEVKFHSHSHLWRLGFCVSMKCDFCEEKATVFFTQVKDDAMKKVALCESCAEEQGVTNPEGLLMADQLLSPAAAPATPKGEFLATKSSGECSACGFTSEDYQKVGRLGCSECYTSFRGDIELRLPTLHKGLIHQGRIPEGLIEVEQLREELAELNADLEKAIEAEDYENAAVIRDRIQQLESRDGEEKSKS